MTAGQWRATDIREFIQVNGLDIPVSVGFVLSAQMCFCLFLFITFIEDGTGDRETRIEASVEYSSAQMEKLVRDHFIIIIAGAGWLLCMKCCHASDYIVIISLLNAEGG